MTVTNVPPARAVRADQAATAVLDCHDAGPLDALVREAARAVGVRDAHLSLLTTVQVTASFAGLAALRVRRGGTSPFDDSICVNALRSEVALVIDDTRRDARVASVPAVRQGVVGAYLGIPLRADGVVIGVLCVLDGRPRHWSDEDVAHVTATAHEIESEICRIEHAAQRARA